MTVHSGKSFSVEQAEGDAYEPLSEVAYREIKRSLSFKRSYAVTVALHCADAALFGLGLWLVSTGRKDAWVLAQFLFVLVFWHGFAILHDCGHSAASEHRVLNTLSGSWASLFCFMPFYPWKIVHQEHHTWTGHLDRDPTASAVRRWKESRHIPMWIRVAWRTWIPAIALVQHIVFWSYPLTIARHHGVFTTKFLKCALSVALLPATYTTAHLLFPALFRFQTFWGALVLYLAVTELINLPHHADMPFGFSARLRPWQQWRTARSCYYPPWLAQSVLLNFNFHAEHHLFPTLPWYRLLGVRGLVRPVLGEHYVECIGAGWNLANRSRDLKKVILEAPTAQPLPGSST